MHILENIRSIKQPRSPKKELLTTISFLILGCGMGLFSKYLDYRQGSLPALLQIIDEAVDLHNYLGEFAPWVFIAVCISVYSNTPVRAAYNVFLFFAGMVHCYYIYCNYVAGFFPRSYAIIWIGFTVLSPLLALFCWYAKGQGMISVLLSAGIIGTFINFAFYLGFFYIVIRSWISIILLASIIVILRKTPKETAVMIGLGVVVFITITLLPFGF